MNLFTNFLNWSRSKGRAQEWHPTHQHSKGGFYKVKGNGTLESDKTLMTIYDDKEGQTWIRPTAEFEDGRFKPLE